MGKATVGIHSPRMTGGQVVSSRWLEGLFGVALTRRVGKGLEITEEGRRLADLARVQLRELANFRAHHGGQT